MKDGSQGRQVPCLAGRRVFEDGVRPDALSGVPLRRVVEQEMLLAPAKSFLEERELFT